MASTFTDQGLYDWAVKQCTKCAKTLELSHFPIRSETGRHRNECRDCINARYRQRKDEPGWRERRNATVRRYLQASHGKKNRAACNRRAKLRFKYGLEAGEYDGMMEAQGGVCAICGQPPTSKRGLVVDHDHATGQQRALLCGRCNIGLGKFRDDPELLDVAAAYLRP